jgi:hypothetical protein
MDVRDSPQKIPYKKTQWRPPSKKDEETRQHQSQPLLKQFLSVERLGSVHSGSLFHF